MKEATGKKVLLLHPPFNQYTFGREWKENKSLSPPLGLLYLGSPLQREEFKVSLVDLNVDKFTKREFLNLIKNQDFILMTCYANAMNNIMKIIKDIKEVNKKGLILCGGPHCNITHEYVEGSFLTCVGEAEGYIAQILNSIILKKPLRGIPGLIYKKNGKIVKTPGVMKVDDLDSTLPPARKLAGRKKYGNVGAVRLDVATIMSTRGCPFNCHFCSHPLNLKKYRQRSIDSVVEEIKSLVRQSYKYILFYDDNFLLNKKRAYKIMDKIIQEKIKVKMALQARVDSADYNLYKRMRDAGVVAVFFGVESANQDVLDFYNKRATVEQGIEAIKLANKVGLITHGYFMIGTPFETKHHFNRNLEYFDTVPLDFMSCNVLTYWIGTQLWNDASNKGIIEKSELHVLADKRLSHYSSEELSAISSYLVRYFYMNPRRLLRIQYKLLRLGEAGIVVRELLRPKSLLKRLRALKQV